MFASLSRRSNPIAPLSARPCSVSPVRTYAWLIADRLRLQPTQGRLLRLRQRRWPKSLICLTRSADSSTDVDALFLGNAQ
jgi:hypothetical protein